MSIASSRARVIIRNLPWSLTGEQLGLLVENHVSHEFVDLMIDSETGKSEGWGKISIRICSYVVTSNLHHFCDNKLLCLNYAAVVVLSDIQKARRVIAGMNGMIFQERKLQAYLEEDADSMAAMAAAVDMARSGYNVFVSNLPWTTIGTDLLALASRFGSVLDVDIKHNTDTGKSRGWALVKYEEKPAAQAAVQALDGFELQGRKLTVRFDRKQNPDEGSDCNIHVGNVNFAVTTDELLKFFSEAGLCPIGAFIPKRSASKNRGFAIVEFSCSAHAATAIEVMNGATHRDRVLKCRLDMGKHRINPSVYVSNLDDQMTEEGLRSLFTHIGPIKIAHIERRPSGDSKQWGYVTSTPE